MYIKLDERKNEEFLWAKGKEILAETYREKYHPIYSIRISTRNFGMVDQIKSVPLYAVFCI